MKYTTCLLLISSLTIGLFSCSSESEENDFIPPKEQALSKEEFIKLMTDVQLIEGHLNDNSVNQVFIMDSAENYYKEIFDRYGITEKEYRDNLKYYSAHPKLLEEVYIQVEENLVLKDRDYVNITDTLPAIVPLNRIKLMHLLIEDTLVAGIILNDNLSYTQIKDSVFQCVKDTLLKQFGTDSLSFRQSFNISTHTKPMFNLFKNELKNKLKK